MQDNLYDKSLNNSVLGKFVNGSLALSITVFTLLAHCNYFSECIWLTDGGYPVFFLIFC